MFTIKLLLTINKWVKRVSLYGAIAIFCLVGVSLFAQIVCRYCLNIALIWVDEFARYGLVWMVFLGGAAAIDSLEETSVTFVKERIPKKIFRWINLFFNVSIVFFLIVLVKTGLTFAEMGKLSKTLALGGISQYVPFMAIPVGSSILAFSFAVRTITDFFGIQEPAFDGENEQKEANET